MIVSSDQLTVNRSSISRSISCTLESTVGTTISIIPNLSCSKPIVTPT